jgi:hypothetical protein
MGDRTKVLHNETQDYADLVHYTTGASEKDEEEAIRKTVDFSTTARRQTVD